MKRLYIETVGCQMNVLDSEMVVASLRKQGFELESELAAADVILFSVEERISLSGTQVREFLSQGKEPPREFSRPEVAQVLIAAERAKATA